MIDRFDEIKDGDLPFFEDLPPEIEADVLEDLLMEKLLDEEMEERK